MHLRPEADGGNDEGENAAQGEAERNGARESKNTDSDGDDTQNDQSNEDIPFIEIAGFGEILVAGEIDVTVAFTNLGNAGWVARCDWDSSFKFNTRVLSPSAALGNARFTGGWYNSHLLLRTESFKLWFGVNRSDSKIEKEVKDNDNP